MKTNSTHLREYVVFAVTLSMASCGVAIDNRGQASNENAIEALGIANQFSVTNEPQSRFYLSNDLRNGIDTMANFGAIGAGWIPIVGDWDGNGKTSIGMYDPAQSVFYLRNSNTDGAADITIAFGAPGAGWIPIAGKWNGQADKIGLYDPKTSVFYLRNSLTTGGADIAFAYGAPGWIPVVGDWDGDGRDSIGLFDPVRSVFYLRNDLSTGFADYTFAFGAPNAGWRPVTGHWTGSNVSYVGLYNSGAATLYQRFSHATGVADAAYSLGNPGQSFVVPLAGDWNGDRVGTGGLYVGAESTVFQANFDNGQAAGFIASPTSAWSAASGQYAGHSSSGVAVSWIPVAKPAKYAVESYIQMGESVIDWLAARFNGPSYIVFDLSDAANFKWAKISPKTDSSGVDCEIGDRVQGAMRVLSRIPSCAPMPPMSGPSLRVIVNGNTVSLKTNGQIVQQYAFPSIGSGHVGMAVSGVGSTMVWGFFDNFTIKTIN